MNTTGYAVVAEGIRKRYGATEALDGVDLAVREGTVCGLLGPNGAGKTTAVRILATLLRFDAGRAEVAGYDVVRRAAEVRTHIGLAGQYAAVDERLSGRQNLRMFGRLYGLGGRAAARRADDLLEWFHLAGAASRPAGQYSGGMRRRLDLAASLILTPAVLFLDEPTSGLDPRGRNEVWDAVRALAYGGTTVLLTTQYLEEADRLADQIAVIAAAPGEGGRVVADGTPDRLKAMAGSDQLTVVVVDAAELGRAAEIVGRICGVTADVDADTRRVSAPVTDRITALIDAVRALDDAGVTVDDIGLRRPTLDDVFLGLTGHHAAAAATEAPL